MLRIREAIVVEGRYDKNTLSQVVDAVILETSGFGIFKDKEKLAMLREIARRQGLVILTDADAVYENWGTPQQRAIRHATPDELAPFAKADGSMGPKVTAVSGYVRSRGKPAWIGALSRIEETLAGEAGTCISL